MRSTLYTLVCLAALVAVTYSADFRTGTIPLADGQRHVAYLRKVQDGELVLLLVGEGTDFDRLPARYRPERGVVQVQRWAATATSKAMMLDISQQTGRIYRFENDQWTDERLPKISEKHWEEFLQSHPESLTAEALNHYLKKRGIHSTDLFREGRMELTTGVQAIFRYKIHEGKLVLLVVRQEYGTRILPTTSNYESGLLWLNLPDGEHIDITRETGKLYRYQNRAWTSEPLPEMTVAQWNAFTVTDQKTLSADSLRAFLEAPPR